MVKVVPFQTWTRIQGSFGLSFRDDPLHLIARKYGTRSKGERLALVRFVTRDLIRQSQSDDENARIERVRFLLAALPESAAAVRGLLQRANAPGLKEVHFSVFCFMPEVIDVEAMTGFAKSVPSLVRNYLLHVRDDRALAAWMAADFIGDHWTKEDGLRVLIEVLHRARFAPARTAALHGVRVLFPRLNGAEQASIRQALNRAARADRNRAVRRAAAALVDRLPSLRVRGDLS